MLKEDYACNRGNKILEYEVVKEDHSYEDMYIFIFTIYLLMV